MCAIFAWRKIETCALFASDEHNIEAEIFERGADFMHALIGDEVVDDGDGGCFHKCGCGAKIGNN